MNYLMRAAIVAAMAAIITFAIALSKASANDVVQHNTCNERGCFTPEAKAIAAHTKQSSRKIKVKSTSKVALPKSRPNMIVVSTAANIEIVVAPKVAEKFKAFTADLIDHGITPKKIHCFATHGHVGHSYHYRGEACDYDFYAACMGCSAHWTRTVADLAARHGLRDGCTFGDCGHFDDGPAVSRNRYAKRRYKLPHVASRSRGL